MEEEFQEDLLPYELGAWLFSDSSATPKVESHSVESEDDKSLDGQASHAREWAPEPYEVAAGREFTKDAFLRVFDGWEEMWQDVVECYPTLPETVRRSIEENANADPAHMFTMVRGVYLTLHPDVSKAMLAMVQNTRAIAVELIDGAVDIQYVTKLKARRSCRATVPWHRMSNG